MDSDKQKVSEFDHLYNIGKCGSQLAGWIRSFTALGYSQKQLSFIKKQYANYSTETFTSEAQNNCYAHLAITQTSVIWTQL